VTLLRRLLDLLPHDTLYVGGRPYMRRWYLFGYAPTPEDPDARMICALCRETVFPGCSAHDGSGAWTHAAEIFDIDHTAVGISASRSHWWWHDHGLGAVRLHEIMASDDSRAFHDHPWPFVSIGLWGTYIELTPNPRYVEHERADLGGQLLWCCAPHDQVTLDEHPMVLRRRFRAPFVNRKAATDLHVLEVERPVWSLFLTRPKQRSWGFAGPFGWLPWRTFDQEFPERDAWTQQ
jgi:hypothetical protein